jgi:hypothetical protein
MMKSRRGDALIVSVLILVGILLAATFGRDYGLSWDEPDTSRLARATLSSYMTLRPLASIPGELRFYGPAFLALAETITDVLSRIFVVWKTNDIRHVAYFFSFILAAVGVYGISRGHVGRVAALWASILFASQPLLFGHAFVNPKDLPFLAFFALSMAAGLLSLRLLPTTTGSDPWAALKESDWRDELWVRVSKVGMGAPREERELVAALAVGAVVLFAQALSGRAALPEWTQTLVEEAHAGVAPLPVQAAFNFVADEADSVRIEAYLLKAERLYLRSVIAAAWMLAGALVLWVGVRLRKGVLKTDRKATAPERRSCPSRVFLAAMIGSGVILGFTVAIRPIAPLAGLLISALALFRLSNWRERGVVIVAYWASAIAVAYAVWPFLWPNPVDRFLSAVQLMGDFPYQGVELFRGQGFTVPELPWFYAGFHVVVRITLPALALGIAGGVTGLIRPRSPNSFAEWIVLWV